jgi:hypothetical protein
MYNEAMNKWVQKSIELAAKPGYLDKLYEIYPIQRGAERELAPEIIEKIKGAVKRKDKIKLIKALLDGVDLFPIKDSYVAYLRKSPKALDLNPKTVERIGNVLLGMGFEAIVANSIQPKETNRQIGPMFRKSLPKLGYPMLSGSEFLAYDGIAILDGSDKALKTFANKHLKTRVEKGLDFVAKIFGTYIIGEAKFLTDFGGHQNAQFNDPYALLHSRQKNLMRIGILDGVVWLPTNNAMHVRIKEQKGAALSALLLRNFIKEIANGIKPPQTLKKKLAK